MFDLCIYNASDVNEKENLLNLLYMKTPAKIINK